MNWSDGNTIDDASWDEAVAREIVIRRLVSGKPINRAAFYQACSELGVKRTRLYELIDAYKARPVTSSLVSRPSGISSGSSRLSKETEAVISDAIEGFYKSDQKPSINQLHKEVARRCRIRDLQAPAWRTIRRRIDAMDPAEIAAAAPHRKPRSIRRVIQKMPDADRRVPVDYAVLAEELLADPDWIGAESLTE